MATPPVFTAGQVLTAAQMNAVGQWVTKTKTTFSAVSSIAANNIFTSDYETYLFVARYTTSSTGTGDFQLSVGGVAAATNYNRQTLNAADTVISGARTNSATNLPGFLTATNGAFEALTIAYINGPQLAGPTSFYFFRSSSAGNFTSLNTGVVSAVHTTATSYDGFAITMSSGTTSGTYTVYGLRP